MIVERTVRKEYHRNVGRIVMTTIAAAEFDRALQKGSPMLFYHRFTPFLFNTIALLSRAQGLVVHIHIADHVHRGCQGFHYAVYTVLQTSFLSFH